MVIFFLTPKQMETHGFERAVATDALVLKYQTINTHNSHQIVIALGQFHTTILRW